MPNTPRHSPSNAPKKSQSFFGSIGITIGSMGNLVAESVRHTLSGSATLITTSVDNVRKIIGWTMNKK